MASLAKEQGKLYRIHWKFQVRVGPRAGETIRGSLQLGRCTKAAAKTKLREIDEWEDRVKTGRHVPGRDFHEVCGAISADIPNFHARVLVILPIRRGQPGGQGWHSSLAVSDTRDLATF